MTGGSKRRSLLTRGTALVVGMVLLGSTATGGLFWFWETRTARFAPLADALAAALPGSSPRVEGGRRRPEPGVSLLQVMLKVPFVPARTAEDEKLPPDDAAVMETVGETVAASEFAGRYDALEVHLRHDGPGGVMTSATLRRPLPPASGTAP